MEPGTRGSVSWSKGQDALGFVGFEVKDGSFVLDYRYRHNSSEEWEEVRYPVRLRRTPCNLGGSRPWFVCPGALNGHHCGRRVAKLYDAGKYFLCRHCYGLTYRSRKEGQKYRALYECQRMHRLLGASANMGEPFPPKPKGMRSDTYLKLRREHDRADREHARRTILELRTLFRRV